MSTIKWIDLRDNTDKARLKVATVNGEDGRQRRFLFIVGLDNRSGRWTAAMDKLQFLASPRGKYLTREVRDGERIQASSFHSVWPNATLSEMSRDQVLLDLAPARQARETGGPRTEEEKGVALETGTVVRLGRNGDGLEVYLSPMGRFVRREDGVNIQETGLLGAEMFLRAPDSRALDRCADGFVRSMLLGEVQHTDDLDRFLRGILDREGPFATGDYERAATVIDAALVRYLNGAYETAQDAYGDANRLYDYLPPYKGAHRGKGAMPLPVAVIAQRLLGDTADKRVLVPNAWDGASFAFLARGSRICAFRGDKDLSRLVTQVREEDTSWSDLFEPAREQGADGLFFNADPLRDASGAREDYRQALGALRALNQGARAVLVLAGDNPRQPGEVSIESRRFMEALGRRFDIETVVETGAELSRQVGTDTGLRIIALRNRPGTEHSLQVDAAFPVVHSWDELKSHIDERIVTIDLREAATESIDVDRVVRENEFQRPYLAFSKVGEAVTMVPKNLQGPLQFALSSLEKVYGPVDRFVEQELGFGANTLGDRFSPEQVDALGLGIARVRAGRGIIIGDETGIGKGRVLAGMATWAQKQGKLVIFVTDRANLFSDLVRDLRDIEEWSRFRPFVMNSDGVLVDVFTNEVLHRGTSAKEMAQVLADNEKLDPSRANILFLTYSQISGEISAKADWVLSQASDALVVVDEAHVAAGSDSNTSAVVVDLVSRAWGAVYSSATWAKTSENLHVYQRAMPETINMASLSDTMRTGGEAFSELFSSMLARDGAFIRREHDLSKIEFVVEVDNKRAARNAELSDKVAEILAAMTYVAGDINKILTKLNSDTTSVLKKARAARSGSVSVTRAEGRMFRSHFGAGSVLYQVMRRFLAVINTDHVTELALKAIAENRKPVIVFEDTGESFVQRLIRDRVIPGIEGEPSIFPDAVPPPTIRDMLRNIMKRLGVITTYGLTEDDILTAAERRELRGALAEQEVDIEQALASQDEDTERGAAVQFAELPGVSPDQQRDWEEGMKRILAMIDALPPMPLNAIDVMYARMADAGLRVGEISGRSIRLEAPDSERAEPIESQRWADFKWKIVHRARKKTDVSRTVYEFNNGDLDLLFINRSAATGISLHSSPRFGDTRRRELLESQIPENPTDRIQLYGRVNRYDQLVTPRIAIPTTGIYGEVRQLMMQNKKLARLSANIRSSRENAAEIKFVPDLINRIGEEVAHRYLEDNGGIRSRLGISEAEMNAASMSLIQRLTSRVALLRVTEQKAVYEEIYEMFDDAIARYELAGENPLKAKELDLRARVVNSKLVIGVDMEGVGSAFDGPVHLKRIEWKEDCRPLLWDHVLETIRRARKQLVDEGYARPQAYDYPPVELIRRAARRLGRQMAMDLLLERRGPEDADQNGQEDQAELQLEGAQPLEPDADGGADGPDELLQEHLGVPALAVLQSELLVQAYTMGQRGPQPTLPVIDDGEPPAPAARDTADAPYKDDPMGISLDRMTQQLLTVLEARMVLELLGTKYASVEAALADPEKNGIKRALARKMWVARHLPQLVPGCVVGVGHDVHHGDGTKSLMREWAVVVGLRPPPKGKEAQLPRWKVDLLFPGDEKARTMTLAALMDGIELIGLTRNGAEEAEVTGTHLIDGDMFLYHERPVWVREGRRDMFGRDRLDRIQSEFDDQFVGTRTKKSYILDGNMYLASEWAQATKQGRGVIYTDDRGLRHRAVMLSSRTSVDLMEHMPVRLWSVPMVSQFLRRILSHEAQRAADAAQAPADAAGGATPTRSRGDHLIFSTSYHGALPGGSSSTKKGTQVLLLPGKGVAMTLERSDIKRAGRALRSYQKTQLRREQEAAALAARQGHEPAPVSEVKISTSAAKGKTPMIFLECSDAEGFDKAVDLLCHAAGVELYLPRGTEVGEIALAVQREYFDARRREALQLVQPGQPEEPAPDAPSDDQPQPQPQPQPRAQATGEGTASPVRHEDFADADQPSHGAGAPSRERLAA